MLGWDHILPTEAPQGRWQWAGIFYGLLHLPWWAPLLLREMGTKVTGGHHLHSRVTETGQESLLMGS